MLSRTKRIPRALFPAINKKGSKRTSQHLRLSRLPMQETRVAVVVSKKVAKSAVARNRIRRRLYSIFETLNTKYPSMGHIVVIVLPGVSALSYKILFSEAETILQSALSRRDGVR